MALTQAEKEHYREIIENTHGKRGERVIPEEYTAFLGHRWSRES